MQKKTEYVVIIVGFFCFFTDQMSAVSDIAAEYGNARQLHKEGDVSGASQAYKEILSVEPNHFAALFYLGSIAFQEHDYANAIIYYERACQIEPNNIALLYNLSVSYVRNGKHKEAIATFSRVLELDPDHIKTHEHIARCYEEKKEFAKAEQHYRFVTDNDPDNVDVCLRFANTLKEIDDFPGAIQQYRRVRLLKPDDVNVTLALANALNVSHYYPESLALYNEILDKNPAIYSVLYNIGFTHKKLGNFDKAIECFQKVLLANNAYAPAHFSLSSLYLTLGDFERGWKEYEWRWAAYGEKPKKFDSPCWDGSDLNGKTILLYAEQGLGDTLQFIRYADLLKKQGARVIFQSQRPLIRLLGSCSFIDQVIGPFDTVPAHDVHCALLSVPYFCKTSLDTIPASIPYIAPDVELMRQWHEILSQDKSFKIGLCWQGNARYQTPNLRRAVAEKSVTARLFEPLGHISGVRLYSLQKVDGSEQIQHLDNPLLIHEFGDDFDESHGRFMDTAAVMKNLDLIISVDTGTAHLAGALGVPVWVLLPYPADWRWLLDRQDSPWYPTMRLFRQKEAGDWNMVIRDIIQEVCKILNVPDTASASIVSAKEDKEDTVVFSELVNTEPQKADNVLAPLWVLNKTLTQQLSDIKDAIVENRDAVPYYSSQLGYLCSVKRMIDQRIQELIGE